MQELYKDLDTLVEIFDNKLEEEKKVGKQRLRWLEVGLPDLRVLPGFYESISG